MKIISLVRSQFSLTPVEVELSLVPGLPQIHVLGLPDAVIRESVVRIRSALRAQGFEFPVAQQVLVNLKPHHIRKSSRGLDLAIACALLFETQQIQIPPALDNFVFYGELGLGGDVVMPEDLSEYVTDGKSSCVLTGKGPAIEVPTISISCLKQLLDLCWTGEVCAKVIPRRPELNAFRFSRSAARAMATVAAGEHHVLVAGTPGTGKTTWMQQIASVLPAPHEDVFRVSRQISRYFGDHLEWRPQVAPHHSATPQAVIGGGLPPVPGQISRAHGGVLALDEWLEYPRAVHEALREPVESGRIRITRAGESQEFPADVLLAATTNLCPCGLYLPRASSRCRCSNHRRREYLHRLNGPMLDRFYLLLWSSDWTSEKEEYSLASVLEMVEGARQFACQRGQREPNSKCDVETFADAATFARKHLKPEMGVSRRRLRAWVQVARTLADLDRSGEILPRHWEQSAKWTVQSFHALEVG